MHYEGVVEPDFLTVANQFVQQIADDGRSGAALCVYFRGKPVMDIWAGKKDHEGNNWQSDTLVNGFSTTKGVASTLVHILAEQGLLDYRAPIAEYWPEFGCYGKENIRLSHVLCHQSGLHRLRPLIDDARKMTNWPTMVEVLASASVSPLPARCSAYQALTYGWLVGEVIQRVTGLSFAEALAKWITVPLELNGIWVGLPDSEMHRRALLAGFPAQCSDPGIRMSSSRARPTSWKKSLQRMIVTQGFRLAGADWQESKAALAPKGIRRFSFNDAQVVQSCIPAANGMFTARDLAKMYAMVAEGGELGTVSLLSPEHIRRMGQICVTGPDKVLPVNMQWRQGYHRVFTTGWRMPSAFGHFGWGGSGAWCDPVNRLAMGYMVNNHHGTSPAGDLRIMSLNKRIMESASAVRRRAWV